MKKIFSVSAAVVAIIFLASCKGEPGAPGADGATGVTQYMAVFQQGLYPEASYAGCSDVLLVSADPSSNYGGCGEIAAGYSTNGALHTLRSVIKFDISNAIPANAVITKAVLTLYSYQYISSDGVNVTFYKMLQAWTEGNGACAGTGDSLSGATWNSAETSGPTAWTSGGGHAENTACSGTMAVNAGSEYFSVEIDTSVIRSWLSDPATNYGLLIKADNEGVSGDDWSSFRSGNSASASQHPRLAIYYTLP